METTIDKFKKNLDKNTAVFAILHEDACPYASILIDGTTDVFVDALINVLLNDDIDRRKVQKTVWNILKTTMANVVYRNPDLANDWVQTLNYVKETYFNNDKIYN